MDYSSANHGLWNFFIWMGVIAGLLLLANVLNRKVAFVRESLIPVAALAGFILLALRVTGLLRVPTELLEMVTYHGIALGFIALSLRTAKKGLGGLFAFKSGALIVSTYLLQAVVGLAISILLSATFMPELFPASGILLPMAYGQGPGQANNVGSTYESLGFAGGRSFGLSLAASGYLCACLVGIWYTRRLVKNKRYAPSKAQPVSGSIVTEAFQDENEVPLSDSVDRLSMQFALVLLTYLITYLVTRGLTDGIAAVMPGAARLLTPLFWGFNFITGSAVAMGIRSLLTVLRKKRLMNRQYQNNYLLNRLSGLAFDLMIIAGIASIDIGDLRGLWLPFALMAAAGGWVTYLYLKRVTRELSPGFAEESFVAMYGMLTGTISSGVLLLRQIDPSCKTPAADQLVVGSGTGILFGVPILVMVGLAPDSPAMLFLTLGLCVAYLAALLLFVLKWKGKRAVGA